MVPSVAVDSGIEMRPNDNKGIDRGAGLPSWLARLPGASLRQAEEQCLRRLLDDLFGYYLVRVDACGWNGPAFEGSRIRMQVGVQCSGGGESGAALVRADAEHLPVASDSIDLVLLQHTLDFCADPHQVLREVERILIPEGKLIVVGFNPWGPWGLWRLLGRYRHAPPWGGRFISRGRLHDWLALLGFDLERSHWLYFRPPLGQRWLMERLEFLERIGPRWLGPLAAVHVTLAVKRVSTLTPIRPAWKIASPLLGGRRIEPTTRAGRG